MPAAELKPSEATAERLGADLTSQIWWEETLSVGDFSKTLRLHPDRFAAQTMVAEILRRAGYDDLVAALKPFANLGVGSGPDEEHDSSPYRLKRGSIRKARAAIDAAEGN